MAFRDTGCFGSFLGIDGFRNVYTKADQFAVGHWAIDYAHPFAVVHASYDSTPFAAKCKFAGNPCVDILGRMFAMLGACAQKFFQCHPGNNHSGNVGVYVSVLIITKYQTIICTIYCKGFANGVNGQPQIFFGFAEHFCTTCYFCLMLVGMNQECANGARKCKQYQDTEYGMFPLELLRQHQGLQFLDFVDAHTGSQRPA
nr:hypothetical protein [Candidatus Symbiobacter mobilis]